MSGAGRHGRRRRLRRPDAAELLPGGRRWLTRLGLTAAVAALVAVATMVAAVRTASSPPAKAGGPGTTAASVQARVKPSVARSAASSAVSAGLGGQAPLTLTAADHRNCPAAALACVDLATHLTWLQSGGKVTFGPVQMEPGQPGSAHQTPQGTFHVAWKAGPAFVSNIYHEAMPWATFFAAGGIAFHAGSLTRWSHGCVHLTLASARYYDVHLPVGAEVVVF